MRGFGDPELKYEVKMQYAKPTELDDATRKTQLAKDIMLACDRNQDQKLNFNE